jgi:hypothetical protein
MATLRRSQTPRQASRATMSITIRIGSMIAAASIGGTTSAISGTPSMETPPRPPFDTPTTITAGMPTA